MGRKKYNGFCNNFTKNFENIRRGACNWSWCRWFTPARGCICAAIFCMLILSGVGLYQLIIIGLLLLIMQLV